MRLRFAATFDAWVSGHCQPASQPEIDQRTTMDRLFHVSKPRQAIRLSYHFI